jgi:ubiquinone/menaquinone biosynthesis C-methylase UbiE
MSSLADQHARQTAWRRWDVALAMVPVEAGQRVLDLGCGIGQIAARLQRLGANVVGIDGNDSLLDYARRAHPDVRFVTSDLRDVSSARLGVFDGIWASFVASYFSDLPSVLAQWRRCLAPGGWIALTEIDDMFGHEPMSPAIAEKIARFYAESRTRYDFEAGRKLASSAQAAGFTIVRETNLDDDELSFDGAASPEVLAAWRDRFERMSGLRSHFGTEAPTVEGAILAALASPKHHSRAKVTFVVGRSHAP